MTTLALALAALPPAPVRAINGHAEQLQALEISPASLTRFAEDALDLEEICARLLGPHRHELSAKQLEEFRTLFVGILVARAWKRADALKDFEHECSAGEHSRVQCVVRRRDEARAMFILRGKRIVDAQVGDLGMVRENRKVIDHLVRTRGVDGLLERMRRKLAKVSGNPKKRP